MNPWTVLPWLAFVAIVFVLLPVSAAVYTLFRETWQVPCPLEHADAEISVDALGAARAEIVGRAPTVASCSLWPRRHGCEQRCLQTPLAGWARTKTLTPA